MKSVYKPNISITNRVTSLMAGAALSALGYRRSSRGLGLLGLGLIARGASGWCPVTAAVDHDGDYYGEESSKRHLRGSRVVIVEDLITLYRRHRGLLVLRNLENLPRFMRTSMKCGSSIGSSHWVRASMACWSHVPEKSQRYPPTLLRGNRLARPMSSVPVWLSASVAHAHKCTSISVDPPAAGWSDGRLLSVKIRSIDR